MQMARYYDRSLSALIRYEGAEKDENGEVITNTIANELAAIVGERESVTAGNIYVTGAGALASALGVKRVFHAATTHGVPGHGYQVMHGVDQCITNSLRRMDQRYADERLQTIVFPMMGTGEGGGDVYIIAPKLIEAVASYFTSNPGSHVAKVYFSAWNMRDLEACQASLSSLAEVREVGQAAR
jgi:O-acetyl-ADP-ribose deacetylase (regulator of RNase III)